MWRAWDAKRERTIALKHPNYEGRASDGMVDKYFEREVDVLQEIQDAGGHPNIMRYYGKVQEFGMAFLVIELIDAEEIGKVVRNEDPITDANEVRQIGMGICAAPCDTSYKII